MEFRKINVISRTVACQQALHLWRTKRTARERTHVTFRVLLSRDFSRPTQMESLLEATRTAAGDRA